MAGGTTPCTSPSAAENRVQRACALGSAVSDLAYARATSFTPPVWKPQKYACAKVYSW